MPAGDEVQLLVGDEDRDLAQRLDEEIYAFNSRTTGLLDGRLLSIRATHAGELVGGLTGWTWGGCGYVDLLWIAESHRGQSIGTALMDRAEAVTWERGGRLMVLSTHSFQAPDFYRGRGYEEHGRVEGYPLGHAQIYLSKVLASAPASS